MKRMWLRNTEIKIYDFNLVKYCLDVLNKRHFAYRRKRQYLRVSAPI